MPVTIEPTENEELTRIRLSGAVALPELMKALDDYGKRGPTRLEIYDASGLEGERFSAEDINSLVDYMRNYPGRRPPEGKTAIVVTKTVDIGITRMFSILSDDVVSFKTEVFRSLDEALDWLNK